MIAYPNSDTQQPCADYGLGLQISTSRRIECSHPFVHDDGSGMSPN